MHLWVLVIRLRRSPKDFSSVWKKVRGLEAGVLRTLFGTQEWSFVQGGDNQIVLWKNSPRQDSDDNVSAVISPTLTGVDCSEELEEASVEEEVASVEEEDR